MPKPRAQLVSLEATSYYHCISRCVRRAFLCGLDPATGCNFDHRKQWIADRMKELTGIFAVDVCSYGLMSNHFHVVLHIDPPRALAWTDEEVAARYERLFRHTVRLARLLPPTAWEKRLLLWRKRLVDLSWFMRCLNESIARRANREDNCTGRFWEGRFRSQALLDVGALLTCMAYVDLNPIRAGIANSLEESDFTSIRERLLKAALPQGLAPFADQVAQSDREPLPMEFADYVEMLRWTVSELRRDRHQRSSPLAPALLARFDLDSAGFVQTLLNFPRSFFTMVGHVHQIDAESERRQYRRRAPGRAAAKRLYRASA